MLTKFILCKNRPFLFKTTKLFAFISSGLTTIYYEGNASEYAEITVAGDNEVFTSATVYYYSPDAQNDSNNGWRYINGVPTAW